MAPLSQSLLWYIAAVALAARGAVVIENFAGPVDAFFLDDGRGDAKFLRPRRRRAWCRCRL